MTHLYKCQHDVAEAVILVLLEHEQGFRTAEAKPCYQRPGIRRSCARAPRTWISVYKPSATPVNTATSPGTSQPSQYIFLLPHRRIQSLDKWRKPDAGQVLHGHPSWVLYRGNRDSHLSRSMGFRLQRRRPPNPFWRWARRRPRRIRRTRHPSSSLHLGRHLELEFSTPKVAPELPPQSARRVLGCHPVQVRWQRSQH